MIHFLTVHWQSPKWIDPQLDYIRRHTSADYRVVACVDPAIPPTEHRKFATVVPSLIEAHADKLNLLAEFVCGEAESPDDWLVFIDSDSVPIADWVPKIQAALGSHELVAVRRDENVGDRQPHPCFCVTTVGFWQRIRGDWREGYRWTNGVGRLVTDVGGNLLRQLEEAGIEWLPLLRSNRVDLHPLFFGVYGGIVYHHGAGSRFPISRADHGRIEAMLPYWQVRLLKKLGRYDRHFRRELERTGRQGEDILGQLVRDPDFARPVRSSPASRTPRLSVRIHFQAAWSQARPVRAGSRAAATQMMRLLAALLGRRRPRLSIENLQRGHPSPDELAEMDRSDLRETITDMHRDGDERPRSDS